MEWTPLLAVIVGSTGLVGAIAAAVQLSRRARLVRSIKAATKAAESVADASQTRAILQQAIEMDTLRLAAGSIVTVSAGCIALHVGILAAPVISFAISALAAWTGAIRSEAPFTLDPVVLEWLGIVMTLVWMFAVSSLLWQFTSVYRLREEWVAAAIMAQNPPVRTSHIRKSARYWQVLNGPAIVRDERAES